jgi:hypothetical protein
MIRDRFSYSSEHQRAYMEDIHEQVWICTEGVDTLSGVRAYMVKMYLQVEMYTIFDYFIRINESGIKKTTCINFVTV